MTCMYRTSAAPCLSIAWKTLNQFSFTLGPPEVKRRHLLCVKFAAQCHYLEACVQGAQIDHLQVLCLLMAKDVLFCCAFATQGCDTFHGHLVF